MKNIKICIVGNSVALRVRPSLAFPENMNYTTLIDEMLNQRFNDYRFTLENKAAGADTIKNIYQKIDSLIQCFPDVYILNIGVVDACTREVPLWFYRLANRKSEDSISLFFRAVYRVLIAKIRPYLVFIRGKRSWISGAKFSKYFSLLIENLKKETNSRILVLPINPASSRIEKILPGSRKNQEKFNTIMKQISADNNLSFVALDQLKPEIHYPDGVHYSTAGHRFVAEKIVSEIIKLLGLK